MEDTVASSVTRPLLWFKFGNNYPTSNFGTRGIWIQILDLGKAVPLESWTMHPYGSRMMHAKQRDSKTVYLSLGLIGNTIFPLKVLTKSHGYEPITEAILNEAISEEECKVSTAW